MAYLSPLFMFYASSSSFPRPDSHSRACPCVYLARCVFPANTARVLLQIKFWSLLLCQTSGVCFYASMLLSGKVFRGGDQSAMTEPMFFA
jgi:hypothetical protein